MRKLIDVLEKLSILANYLRFRARFRRLRRLSRVELEKWQNRQVVRFLSAVLAKSPFYRRWTEGIPAPQWKRFKLIDKRIMMENFSGLNTVGIEREAAFRLASEAEKSRDFTPVLNGVTVGLSSGTSGNRGIFLASRKERLRYAGAILSKALPGSILKNHRVALFLRANSNLYSTAQGGKIRFRFFDLLRPLAELASELNAFDPTLILGPPSLLRKLAVLQEEGGLQVAPDRIYSVAEVLEPLDQARIEKAFQKPVHQIYQCTEGFLGISCEQGTLHLNEDLVVIEKDWLDREQRKFAPVITDFSRMTQPILRYRLNDILTESAKPCACGSPFTAIESIEGRCDDMILLPPEEVSSAREWVEVFPDFIRRAILFASDRIDEYRVIQRDAGLLEISLRLDRSAEAGDWEGIRSSVEREIGELCGRMRCRMPVLRFSSDFEELGLKKLRRVENRWQLNNGN